MDFKEAYTPPFHVDKYGPYVWSANGTMSLMFERKQFTTRQRQIIVDILNGEIERPEKLKTFEIKNYTELTYEGNVVALIRGWGYLTGTGGLNLEEEVAAKTQDDFANWIVETLNKK